ncbi:unnamed protein product [marine sediment metagenome]|uniref:Uncharacterized protein n=1 Tax=marine sediment metagenome TaxID=412755 RepID=X1SI90_9ZZZZ
MAAKKGADKTSKDEQIGFHKGSLTTLVKERQELARIIGIVEQLIQFHMGALKELGVDLAQQTEIQEAMGVSPGKKGSKKKPIDEIL